MMSSSRWYRQIKRQAVSPSPPLGIMRCNATKRGPRIARAFVAATAVMAFGARAGAQQLENAMIEVRPLVGAIIGTGDQARELKSAVLVGTQVSYSFVPHFAVVGTFGWSPSQDRLDAAQPKVDLYQYELGVEGRWKSLTAGSAFAARPYTAFGAGGRTYSLRGVANATAHTDEITYGAIGLDVYPSDGRVGLRLELRDNVTAFTGFRGELADGKTRNDVQLSAGLTIGF
jgi:hypothetical protein